MSRKQFFNKKISRLIWTPNKNYKKINTTIKDTWFTNKLYTSKVKNKLFEFKNLTNKPVLRSNKIKIYPNEKQKKILLQWIELYKFVYNFTVRYYRLNKNDPKNFKKIRPIIKKNLPEYIKQQIKNSKIPSHTIDNAINDVIKAYISNFELLKLHLIKHFKIRYKRNASLRQSLTLEASCFSFEKQNNSRKSKLRNYEKEHVETSIKYLFGETIENYLEPINESKFKNSFCTSIFGDKIKSTETLKNIKHDCRLTYNKAINQFYLCIPEEREIKINTQKDICILDPGLRTFQTCMSSNNLIKYGTDVNKRLKQLLLKTDKHNKLYNENKKKYNKKVYYKTYNKINNLITELHNKVSNDLCKTYKCIMIGRLSTVSTNKKHKSCLSKMNKRLIQILSHYKFREILKHKCELNNIKYLDVCEKYTTKTCSICGNYKKKLTSEKTYKCKKCKSIIDRDYNACRNIFIRNYSRIY